MDGNSYPKLHNAMWPGLVGKGPDSEPPIDLDTMLRLTSAARPTAAQIRGRRSLPRGSAHIHRFVEGRHQAPRRQDRRTRACRRLGRGAGLAAGRRRLRHGVGGGAQAVPDNGRGKACRIARQLRDIGIRQSGVVRIDSATGVHDWADNPAANQKVVAKTFSDACDVAEQYGEALGGRRRDLLGRRMHSWKHMVELLEMVGEAKKRSASRPDMAHSMLYTMGYNAPEHRDSARRITIGRDLQDAGQRPQGACARVAAVDLRLPCRTERRDR